MLDDLVDYFFEAEYFLGRCLKVKGQYVATGVHTLLVSAYY
jgi:hypothetical protein